MAKAKKTIPEKKTVPTKAICTINKEYARVYSKEIHGNKFIDMAAEFCSKNTGREFTTE